MGSRDDPSGAAARNPIRRVAATALAGSSIEWYDFFAYGTAAALVFPQLFFPPDLPPFVALMASFSTFAVGFLARPIGGIVFGHYGDRYGRKRALGAALYAMGIATTLIGCLPTYATAGPLAPLLLIVLRFVQGFAVGGQWGGAVLMLTENAPPTRRGFYGSFAQVGVPVGVIFANLVFLVMDELLPSGELAAWGWRVPFLLSVLLIFVARYVHLRLEETPEFQQTRAGAPAAAPQASPVFAALRMYPREIALAAGAFLGIQVPFYILITYVIAYGTDPGGLALPYRHMLTAVLLSAFVMIPALLIAGAASDRYGRRRVYMTGAVLVGLWSFAVFPLLGTGSLALAVLALGAGQAFVSLMYGPQAAFLSEMFAPSVRYSSVSLGYQFGSIVGGGFAPTIAAALLYQSGTPTAIAAYMAVACVITLVSVILLKASYERALAAVAAERDAH
jgi:MFS family permease